VALGSRCLHLGIPLTVNGRPSPSLEAFPFAPRKLRSELLGSRITALLTPCLDRPAAVDFVQHGVIVAQRPFSKGIEHFVAVVDAPALPCDLSDLALVQGPEVEALEAAAVALHAQATRDVDLSERFEAWLQGEARRHVDALEAVHRPRRRCALVIDYVLYLIFLQVPALLLGVLLAKPRDPYGMLLLFEGTALLLAGVLSGRRQLTFGPRPDDVVGRMIDERLAARPLLHAAAARIVWGTSSGLRDYLEDPDLTTPRW
jgi:hypothetical protein